MFQLGTMMPHKKREESIPSLYEIFRFDNEKSNPFFAIEHFKGPLDVYCTECGRHSVFKLMHEVSNYTVVSPMFAPNDDPPCSSRDACQT